MPDETNINQYYVALSVLQIVNLNTRLAKEVFSNSNHPILGQFRTGRHDLTADGKHYRFEVDTPFDPTDGLDQNERYKEYSLDRFDAVPIWARKAFPQSTITSANVNPSPDEEPYSAFVDLDLTDPYLINSLLQEIERHRETNGPALRR